MAMAKLPFLASLIACMVIIGCHGQATVTCDQVTIWLTPCISYAVLGGDVSQLCCQGIYSLHDAEKNDDDRRASCQCIKDRASYIPGIDYDRANAIPTHCNTTCPYKVYPTTDCSKV